MTNMNTFDPGDRLTISFRLRDASDEIVEEYLAAVVVGVDDDGHVWFTGRYDHVLNRAPTAFFNPRIIRGNRFGITAIQKV